MQNEPKRDVTAEDVVWCYQFLLGRAPKSSAIVQHKAAHAPDFQTLVTRIVNSEEFKRKNGLARPPLDGPAMRVDWAVPPDRLRTLRDRVRNSWAELGRTTPHYSVLTDDEFLPENINEKSIEKFYESGVVETRMIKSILNRHGFVDAERKVCVEFGCGLGRVTLPLASLFERVYGYDVSASHLRLAEERGAKLGCENVKFILWEDLEQDIDPCDFFYSRIVFQHNSPPVIRMLIEAALSSLKGGGIAIFQVPTYSTRYSFDVDAYLGKAWEPRLEMHCIPQAVVFEAISKANCQVLEVREDDSVGKLVWVSNIFVVERPVG